MAYEAQVVTVDTARAALTYLQGKLADGTYTECEAFPRTGGYINMWAHDVAHIEALLADYPLRHTIKLDVDELVSLDDGFAVLIANIEAEHAGGLHPR